MSEETLSREQILVTAEEVLRRFGPAKATVVDVARALGVSHGSVYRHFPSKAALRDAVAQRWLARLEEPLAAVKAQPGPAVQRLRRWFEALLTTKRNQARTDPALFATYVTLVAEARQVTRAHVDELVTQLREIIADGVASGAWQSADPAATARAIWVATTRFHHPAHAQEWSAADIDDSFEDVWSLILAGLGVPPET